MPEKHKHDWKKISDKKVRCECGAETWISWLSPKQRAKLQEIPKYEPTPVDVLMWVGSSYYNPESLIREAHLMGCCKRVPMLPRGVVKGKSRVFLAHREARKQGSGIFAYFTVRGISYVAKGGVDIPEALKERGVEKWEYIEGGFGFSDERGCGSLAIGGTYLLSEEDMEKCRDLADSGVLEGRIEVLEPPIPISSKPFRGYKHVIGDLILQGAPEAAWFGEAHEIYIRNKKAMARWKRQMRKLQKKA